MIINLPTIRPTCVLHLRLCAAIAEQAPQLFANPANDAHIDDDIHDMLADLGEELAAFTHHIAMPFNSLLVTFDANYITAGVRGRFRGFDELERFAESEVLTWDGARRLRLVYKPKNSTITIVAEWVLL
jgi:hypothetical protein